MMLSTLSKWFNWIESVHSNVIELELERVKTVAQRLHLLPFSCPVVLIGGTNGKGSVVAGLETIYRLAGYRIGAFTSPTLLRPNEQIRRNGQEISDIAFCTALAKVEAHRGTIPLTSFEFRTLAALWFFKQQPLDLLLLEVGLGGRLDAVNIVDASLAIITSISIDHTDRLGSTRTAIAREKAGIFRAHHPAICGDPDPPASLIAEATRLYLPFFCQGRDFYYQEDQTHWSWHAQDRCYDHLPFTSLALQNMSTVLMATTQLPLHLPVQTLRQALPTITLPGRIQTIPGPIMTIYDVAHNPASVMLLADHLDRFYHSSRLHAVFSMLADKDIATSLGHITKQISQWYIAPLPTKRSATIHQLLAALPNQCDVYSFTHLPEAYQAAKKRAQVGDCIVVFGSFYTVAEVMKLERRSQ